MPNADAAALIAGITTAVEHDRFFVLEKFDDSIDPASVATEPLDCNDSNSRSLGTAIALAEAEPADADHTGIQLAFTRLAWRVAVVEFADEDAATTVVDALERTMVECPTGEAQIPLQDADGSQATDDNGDPISITARLVDTPLELDVAGHAVAARLATEFVGASGDTAEYRGAFRRGPFVVYLSGHDSEANFRRLVATADEVLRAAS